MEFGMPTLIENKTLEENVRLCQRLGLQFIELNMNFPEYQLDALERTDRFYRAAEEAGIYYTVHLDERLDIADFNPLAASAYLETVRRTVEAAKKLLPLRKSAGAKEQPMILNLHMNHGIHITLPDKKVCMYDRNFEAYMEAFVRFRALCEEWIGGEDLAVSVENTDGFRGYEKAAVECLLESPKFALTWDIGHSKASGEIDEGFLREHACRLRHFHIHDGTAGTEKMPGRNHLALGDGEIDLKERLSLAKAQKARCVLETKTAEALERSVEYFGEI